MKVLTRATRYDDEQQTSHRPVKSALGALATSKPLPPPRLLCAVIADSDWEFDAHPGPPISKRCPI
jgi:hypothetical protein